MMLWRGRWAHFGRKRRNVGQGCEEVIRFVEEIDLRFAMAVGDGDKDAGLALGAQGQVSGESGAASGLLHDGGRAVRGTDLNPSQADAGCIAGMAEALH
jgi:hypothetical protein